MTNLPKKRYYKIGEIAEYFGIEPHTLRFWEKQFPQLKPKRYSSNQRFYTQKEVDIISLVYDLLYKQNFTIKGAQSKVAEIYLSKKDLDSSNIEEESIFFKKDELLDIKNSLKEIKILILEL
ncbi:MerR family transcriptional regulator [bacterium]|nr:MerR family transcriptional regulator [bacterium]